MAVATDLDTAGMVIVGTELTLPGVSKDGSFAPTILVGCTIVLGGLEAAARALAVDTTCGKAPERATSEEREGTLVSDGTLKEGEEVVDGATDGVGAEVGVVVGGA